MSSHHHHTTPFRRPASTWHSAHEQAVHDPADMGTEYGLEMRLVADPASEGSAALGTGQGADGGLSSAPGDSAND